MLIIHGDKIPDAEGYVKKQLLTVSTLQTGPRRLRIPPALCENQLYAPYSPAFQAYFDPVGMSGGIRQDLGDDSLCHVPGPLVLLQQDFNAQSRPDVGTLRSIHSPPFGPPV